MIEDEAVIEQPKDFVLAANALDIDPINIKVEPKSQHIQSYTMDSEVQILSPQNQVILLQSDSEEDSMIRFLEKDTTNLGRDRYQMQLNAESQEGTESPTLPQASCSPSAITQEESQSSDSPTPTANPQQPPQASSSSQDRALSENNSLRNYQLRVHQFAMDDIQNAAATGKRKNQAQMRGRPKKKPKRNPTPKISYRDSEEQQSTPVKPPGRNLQNTLSTVNDKNFSSSSEVEKAFTFNSHRGGEINVDNGATCYIFDFQRFTFKRNLICEISIHLPQFSCYDVQIKDDNIQHVLNLKNNEWQALKDNLNIIGEYEYIHGHPRNNKQNGYGTSIVRQLDLYFSTLSQFKSFQVFSNGHAFTTAPSSSIPLNLPTLNAIDSDILRLMKK